MDTDSPAAIVRMLVSCMGLSCVVLSCVEPAPLPDEVPLAQADTAQAAISAATVVRPINRMGDAPLSGPPSLALRPRRWRRRGCAARRGAARDATGPAGVRSS